MKYFCIISFALVIILLSCSREDLVRNTNEVSHQSKGFGLTLDNMRNIGLMHNEIILQLHKKINLSCENCEVEVINELKNILRAKLNRHIEDENRINLLANNWIDAAILDGRELNLLDYDIKAWNNNILSDKGMMYFKQIEKGINQSNSVKDIDSFMGSLITKVHNSDLSNYEQELIITSAEVGRNSYKLWAPRKIGGIGLFNDINQSNPTVLRRWCWKCALAGDVGGVTAYVNGLAVTGLINAAWVPGANGAIAVGAAASAVGGSIISGSGVFSADKLEAVAE